VVQAFLYILFITNSVQIYRVNESCNLSPAAGVGTLRWIISAAWMWSISWYVHEPPFPLLSHPWSANFCVRS
jgi:hypothetical protein